MTSSEDPLPDNPLLDPDIKPEKNPWFFLPIPVEIELNWEWVLAFYLFDYGDVTALSKLLRRRAFVEPFEDGGIPRPMRLALADIIEGKRPPRKDRAPNAKISAELRLEVAKAVMRSRVMKKYFSEEYQALGYEDFKPGLETISAISGEEPWQLRRQLEEVVARIDQKIINKYDISPRTLKKIKKELQDIIDKWPEV